MGEAAYGQNDAVSHLQVNTFLPGAGLRKAVNGGGATQYPVRLFDISAYITDPERSVDFLFLQVSPADHNGNHSLGLSVDYMHAALARKPVVIAEINPQMPRTHGQTTISADQIDYALDVDYPPQPMPAGKADDIDEKVAEHVVGLLGDDMVLQYGIGTIPELVPVRAGHLKGLSIHTGLITDAIIAAMQTGSFDNYGQPDHPGKIVTTMAGGSAGFYQYLDNNTDITFQPTTYTHSREVLRRIDKLVAINSVLQVDLAGRANAERAGGRIISGPGGLFDFARGATESRGGISVLALRACTRRGDQSCIVNTLGDDAATTVTTEHLDYVVTEYGVASVRDKTGAALARELAAIAHPEYRRGLAAG
jgi:4-hydroxybutyrate CoA-transferase